MKQEARKNWNNLQASRSKTGGGEPEKEKLSKMDQRVLRIITFAEPIQGAMDSNYPEVVNMVTKQEMSLKMDK